MADSGCADAGELTDARLARLLESQSPEDHERTLEDLLEHARPIVRAVVRRELRGETDFAAAGLAPEDVEAEAIVQILSRLSDLASGFNTNPIRDFAAYVAVASFHACHAALRQLYPERARLKNRLRYLLSHDSRFATWESTSRRLCGMRAWADGAESLPAARRLHDVGETAAALIADVGGAAATPRESWLVLALLARAGGPVELDDLTGVVAQLLDIRDPQTSRATRDRVELSQIPDERVSVVSELLDREYLTRLWDEVCQLPVRQRVALLLNLRDDQGRGVVALLPRTRTATIREIAAALEIPLLEFAELWSTLPIDDVRIAERLGVTRQQVINLRKSARDRLARRLQRV